MKIPLRKVIHTRLIEKRRILLNISMYMDKPPNFLYASLISEPLCPQMSWLLFPIYKQQLHFKQNINLILCWHSALIMQSLHFAADFVAGIPCVLTTWQCHHDCLLRVTNCQSHINSILTYLVIFRVVIPCRTWMTLIIYWYANH